MRFLLAFQTFCLIALFHQGRVSAQNAPLYPDGTPYDPRLLMEVKSYGIPISKDEVRYGKENPLFDYFYADLLNTKFWILPTVDPTKINREKTLDSFTTTNILKTTKPTCEFPSNNITYLPELSSNVYIDYPSPQSDSGSRRVADKVFNPPGFVRGIGCKMLNFTVMNEKTYRLMVPDKSGKDAALNLQSLFFRNGNNGSNFVLFDQDKILRFAIYTKISMHGQDLDLPIIAVQVSTYKLGKKNRFGNNPF